jgi:hypothetical protein
MPGHEAPGDGRIRFRAPTRGARRRGACVAALQSRFLGRARRQRARLQARTTERLDTKGSELGLRARRRKDRREGRTAEKERPPWRIKRASQGELAAARKVVRQPEMARAIAEGRLIVRTMTAEEHAQSDARWTAAAATARARGPQTSRYR